MFPPERVKDRGKINKGDGPLCPAFHDNGLIGKNDIEYYIAQ